MFEKIPDNDFNIVVPTIKQFKIPEKMKLQLIRNVIEGLFIVEQTVSLFYKQIAFRMLRRSWLIRR